VVFFLTQSVVKNPIRVADEGSIVRRRATPTCEAAARRDAFERSESLPTVVTHSGGFLFDTVGR
jgi:transcriptional regulator NrdR family protein